MLLLNYVIPISSLAVGLLSLIVFCYALVKARQFIIILAQSVQEIFEPRGQDQPSYFGEILHEHARDIGQEVGQGVQRGLTGSMGGTVKRANQEIESAMIAHNPQLAQQQAFKNMLPKSMQKNDLVSTFMQAIFQKAIGIGGGNGNQVVSDTSNHNPNDNMWG